MARRRRHSMSRSPRCSTVRHRRSRRRWSPIARRASGGYVSYVPIAYAQSLRIALVGCRQRRHESVHRQRSSACCGSRSSITALAPGTAVASFAAGQDFAGVARISRARGRRSVERHAAAQSASSMLAPGATLDLATRSGPGWLRGIRLQLPRSAYADVTSAPRFRRRRRRRCAARGFLRDRAGRDDSGARRARRRRCGRLAVRMAADAVRDVGQRAARGRRNAAGADRDRQRNQLRRRRRCPPLPAASRRRSPDSCVAGGDLALYTHRGPERSSVCRARYHADGVVDLGYLEGDERAYLDDAVAPAWYGTGIEDFFNARFLFRPGRAMRSRCRARREVDPTAVATTAAYRWMLGDALTYAERAAARAGSRLRANAAGADLRAHDRPRVSARSRIRSSPYDRFEVGDATARRMRISTAGSDAALR